MAETRKGLDFLILWFSPVFKLWDVFGIINFEEKKCQWGFLVFGACRVSIKEILTGKRDTKRVLDIDVPSDRENTF